jgi:hypothetical protein
MMYLRYKRCHHPCRHQSLMPAHFKRFICQTKKKHNHSHHLPKKLLHEFIIRLLLRVARWVYFETKNSNLGQFWRGLQ